MCILGLDSALKSAVRPSVKGEKEENRLIDIYASIEKMTKVACLYGNIPRDTEFPAQPFKNSETCIITTKIGKNGQKPRIGLSFG